MTVPFVNTPITRNPGFYFEVDASQANTGRPRKKALILGQVRTPVVASGVPELCPSVAYAKATYGRGSMLALQVAAYRARDPYGEIWVLPVPDPAGGVASTAVATFTGTATAAGTLSAYVCGTKVQVACASGTTAAALAIALQTAVNNAPDLAATGTSAASGVFTTTLWGLGINDIDIRFNYLGARGGEAFPSGISVTTQRYFGTGTPDLATALATVGDTKYDIVVMPWVDTGSLDALKNWLGDTAGRWAPTRKLFGHGFAAMRSTLSAAGTLLSARNDQHMTIMPVNNSPTPAWLISADLAGSIANPIRNDPGLPLQRLPMGWLPPPDGDAWDFSERDVLLYEGGSTFEVASDGTPLTSRLATTYQRNPFGVADNAYLDTETPFQIAEVIEVYEAEFSSKYARKKIVADDTRLGGNNPDVLTPKIMKAGILAVYRAMEAQGKVQDAATFKNLLQVEYVGEGRVNVLMPVTLAGQLRMIASLVQFRKP